MKQHSGYNEVFFDLDGTLIYSHPGIYNGIRYALTKKGMSIPEEGFLRRFIGPSFYEAFPKYLGTSEQDTLELIDEYRIYYKEKGVKEVNIIPKMDELVKKVYQSGKKVFLATGKPQLFAEEILEGLGLTSYFEGIVGSNFDGSLVEKEDVIAYIFNNYEIKNPIMVGDREFDIIGANKNNIDSVGVTFGYGSYEMLSEHKPTYIVDNVEDLEKILL